MILFEVLTEDEELHVRRWQAPELDAERVASVVTGESCTHASASGLHPVSTTTPLPGASADMLQNSYDEGYADALAAANADSRQQDLSALQNVLGSLARQSEGLGLLIEEDVLALARAMARLILRREIELDPGFMRGIVREALAQLPSLATPPQVYLHPLDAAAVRGLLQAQDTVLILDDARLMRGDCRVEAGAARLAAGVDEWIAAIAMQLDSSGTEVAQCRPEMDDSSAADA